MKPTFDRLLKLETEITASQNMIKLLSETENDERARLKQIYSRYLQRLQKVYSDLLRPKAKSFF